MGTGQAGLGLLDRTGARIGRSRLQLRQDESLERLPREDKADARVVLRVLLPHACPSPAHPEPPVVLRVVGGPLCVNREAENFRRGA